MNITTLLRNSVVRLLDRPGGRPILGKIATHFMRRYIGNEAEMFFDGFWVHRVGAYYFPDERFNYPLPYLAWKNQPDYYFSLANCWFKYYHPKEGDVVIDVGAGRGEDTLSLSLAVGKTGLVIAIEANPRSYKILTEFCRLNKLDNVIALNLAVMDKPGSVKMVECNDWRENSITGQDGVVGINVRAETLDNICDSLGVKEAALLKMNIEGAERYALQGMGSIIKRVRAICVACHDFRAKQGEQFCTRGFVKQFLVEQGFKIFSLPEDPRIDVRDHVYGRR